MQIKHLRSQVDPNSLTPIQEYYDAIMDLNRQHGWDKDFNPFLYEVFIAYNPRLNELAGFGCIGERGDGTPNVLRYDLVDPIYRGNKIQLRLIKTRLEFLRLQGHDEVEAYVAPENMHSLNNLIDCGFRFNQPTLAEFKGKTYQSLRYTIV